MVESMKSVAKMDVELTVEERNLLSVAYKNVIGARRASSRIISSIEQKEENKGNEQHVSKIKDYRQKVENELSSICNDILSILDRHLIPSATTGESKVRPCHRALSNPDATPFRTTHRPAPPRHLHHGARPSQHVADLSARRRSSITR